MPIAQTPTWSTQSSQTTQKNPCNLGNILINWQEIQRTAHFFCPPFPPNEPLLLSSIISSSSHGVFVFLLLYIQINFSRFCLSELLKETGNRWSQRSIITTPESTMLRLNIMRLWSMNWSSRKESGWQTHTHLKSNVLWQRRNMVRVQEIVILLQCLLLCDQTQFDPQHHI